MTDYNQILLSILLILLSVLIIFLIIAVVKFIITTDKVNIILEDVQKKIKSVNGFFTCLDNLTDTISLIGDVFVDKTLSFIDKLIGKKRKEEKDYE